MARSNTVVVQSCVEHGAVNVRRGRAEPRRGRKSDVGGRRTEGRGRRSAVRGRGCWVVGLFGGERVLCVRWDLCADSFWSNRLFFAILARNSSFFPLLCGLCGLCERYFLAADR